MIATIPPAPSWADSLLDTDEYREHSRSVGRVYTGQRDVPDVDLVRSDPRRDDGSVTVGAPKVLLGDYALTAEQARNVAQLLVRAADLLDQG